MSNIVKNVPAISILVLWLCHPSFTAYTQIIANEWVSSDSPVYIFRDIANPVSSVSYRPNESMIAGASDRVVVWNTSSGAVSRQLQLSRVYHVLFSPNGNLLFCGAPVLVQGSFVDMNTGSVVHSVNHPLSDRVMTMAAFSPDSKLIATAAISGSIRIWDVESGDSVAHLEAHRETRWVSFSPDGVHMASAGADSVVHIWNVQTWEVEQSIPHSGYVQVAEYSPDGTKLLTVAYQADGSSAPAIWDAATRDLLYTYPTQPHAVATARFHPDGTRFVTAAYAGSIIEGGEAVVWDVTSRKALVRIDAHGGYVFDAAFSPDGTRLATAGADSTVKVWDLERVLDVRSAGSEVVAGGITVYPNPASGEMEIGFAIVQPTDVTILLMDLLGRPVQTHQFPRLSEGYHLTRLDVSGLSSGSYLAVVLNGEYTQSKPVVISR